MVICHQKPIRESLRVQRFRTKWTDLVLRIGDTFCVGDGNYLTGTLHAFSTWLYCNHSLDFWQIFRILGKDDGDFTLSEYS